jgi:hypothetical protein
VIPLPRKRILIMDTSVLMELLQVPGKSSPLRLNEVREVVNGMSGSDQVVVGFASLVEAGNHIGQLSDGTLRRHCALVFQQLVQDAAAGKAPFALDLRPDTPAELGKLMGDFEQWVTSVQAGLGDKSMVELWNLLKATHGKHATVEIWSFDQHLQGYQA